MTLEQAAGKIRSFEYFVLASHDGPDADGLGAAYALILALESIGKKARMLLIETPVPKLAFIDRRGYFAKVHDSPDLPFEAGKTCAIIVDTHDFAYLGSKAGALVKKAGGLIVLDHHEVHDVLDERFCVDPTASSTCEMVWMLGKLLGAQLPLDAAEAIFAGIVYDTGSFAYPKTSEATFECARELASLGVQPSVIHNRVYESAALGALLLQKIVFGRMELGLGNRVAIQILRQADLKDSGASYEDAEDLVNLPLRSSSILVSLLIKENSQGQFRCSLRSKGSVNVARIAQGFGGGGHRTASGFTSQSELEDVKATTLKALARALDLPTS